jgi:hypothetical protein
MAERFSLFGLELCADFPLPCLVPSEGNGRPEVRLSLVSSAHLEAAWSGRVVPGRWRGLLGDGEPFEIERGRAGDLLFAYGGRARFHLSADARALACCPADVSDRAWLRALVTKVLPNVAIANGYEALHASAVGDERGAILILAASGGGKSTLALELARRGFSFLADDVVVLGHGERGVEAHPAGPFVNLPPRGARDALTPHILLDPGPLKQWVAVEGAAIRPTMVRALVRLELSTGGVLGAWSMGPSPVPLTPFMLGLPDDEGRDGERFELYSDLVESARMVRLTAGIGNGPADLAETLLRAFTAGRAETFEVAS